MDYDSLLELVKRRRSIRKFKPEPIPDEYVEKIIEVARWAPSASNSQPWEFVVVKKKELRDNILQFIGQYNVIVHQVEHAREPELRVNWTPAGYAVAPVFIVLCGDPRTKDAYPLLSTLERGQPIFTSSQANAFLYMTLAVTTLGLTCQWMSITARSAVQALIKELLGIPMGLEVYDTMAVGYPAAEPKTRLVRAKEEMVHYDHYDQTKFRTDEEVKNFIVALHKSRG